MTMVSPQAWNALAHARATWVLSQAGIDSLVLKGASTAAWLYRGEDREVGDVDLMVRPADASEAWRTMSRDGGCRALAPRPVPGAAARHSIAMACTEPDYELDLHYTFPGITVDPAYAWSVLWERRVPFAIGGVRIWQLDETGRALVLVLHAACDGGRKPKTAEDLSRCLALDPGPDWTAVAELARGLGALPAFITGLQTHSAGQRRLAGLGLGAAADPEWLLRAAGQTYAVHLLRINRSTGRERLRLLARAAWPPADAMRYTRPLATRGALGMAAARSMRALGILRALPSVLWSLRRAQRRSLR